jgi:hypothetical protein
MSGEEECYTWSVLVSKDGGLVCVDQNDPELGDFVAGHRLQNSIFTRQLSALLSSSLGLSETMSLSELPGRMNGSAPMIHAFECHFVGNSGRVTRCD